MTRYASDPCNSRMLTWIAVKHGGDELGEVVVAQEYDALLAREAALQQRLNEADQRIDEAEQLLKTNWVNDPNWECGTQYFCPECRGNRDEGGHSTDCRVFRFLNQLTKDSPEVGS